MKRAAQGAGVELPWRRFAAWGGWLGFDRPDGDGAWLGCGGGVGFAVGLDPTTAPGTVEAPAGAEPVG